MLMMMMLLLFGSGSIIVVLEVSGAILSNTQIVWERSLMVCMFIHQDQNKKQEGKKNFWLIKADDDDDNAVHKVKSKLILLFRLDAVRCRLQVK